MEKGEIKKNAENAKNKEEKQMYFAIMAIVAILAGLAGLSLSYSGILALLNASVVSNNQWASLVVGLILVIVAIILAIHLVNWRRLGFLFLEKAIEAQEEWRQNPTPENAKKWRKAKFTLDLHLGKVSIKAGGLDFHQESSLTSLDLPPGFGNGPGSPPPTTSP